MVTLIVITAVATITLNMFLPSLNTMAAEFGVPYSVVTLTMGGYFAMTAVVMLVVGPLSDRYGRRPVILVCLSIYTLASIGCYFAEDFDLFLFFRMAQAVVISGWAMAMAAIRDLFPRQEAASRIGYVTMAMAVAPMLGPLVGGLIDSAFGWRAIFATYAALGVAALLLCWRDFGETNTQKSATFAKQFITYPTLLKAGRFWGYALCQAFSVGTFYTFLAGAPLIATASLDVSTPMLGFYLGMITAGFACGSFLSGKFSKRIDLTSMVFVGRVVGLAGLLISLSLFLLGSQSVLAFFVPVMLVGVGNGLSMPGTNAGAMSVVPKLAGSAAGLNGAMAVGVGAILTTVAGAVVVGPNGIYALLALMIFTVIVSLVGILAARSLETQSK